MILFDNINEINLDSNNIKYSGIDLIYFFSNFKELKKISYCYNTISCPQLVNINPDNFFLKNIEKLMRFPNLKILDISNNFLDNMNYNRGNIEKLFYNNFISLKELY